MCQGVGLQKSIGNTARDHNAAEPNMNIGEGSWCPSMLPLAVVHDSQDKLTDQSGYDDDAEDLMSRCKASCLETISIIRV